MPSKKKKYNARFPAGRIKKIMQSDEEIGKVAQAVPVIISRTLELFVESLLTKTLRITNSRNAKTLSTSHMKQCIMSEQRFDFLKELVRNIPDISVAEEASSYNDDEVELVQSSPEEQYPDSDTPYDLSLPSTSVRGGGTNGGGSAYTRSMSLNGSGLKRQNQQLPQHQHPSVIVPNVAALALHHAGVPAKLSRSESTPAPVAAPSYTPRGRPPLTKSYDTAIPAPICSYELNKPIVKIDYSHVHAASKMTTPESNTNASANAAATFNFDLASPVINIDLTNIVPTVAAAKSNNNNNNHQIAGKSSAPLIIPKATNTNVLVAATPPPPATTSLTTESCFELDEDYDNI